MAGLLDFSTFAFPGMAMTRIHASGIEPGQRRLKSKI
jgi:hypothetical protein